MKKLFLSVLLFTTVFSFAQEFYFKQKPFMFFDNNSNQIILVENDSTIIKTKKKNRIKLKSNNILAPLSEYIPFYIQKKTYFVHNGCGVVLEYRNDSIVRIDNSYLHKNQFGAASFVYKDEIYFFGGYGMFTHKNILTKYDFKLREWLLVNTFEDEKLPPLTSSYFKINGNYLYVFGGSWTIKSNVFENKEDVWQLNLKTMRWKKFKTNLFKSCPSYASNCNNTIYFNYSIIFKSCKSIVGIDFKKNIISKYNTFFDFGIISSFFMNNQINVILEQDNTIKNGYYVFKSFPINDILKNPISEESFYYEEQPYYLYGIVGIFILLMLWFLYRKKRFISYYLSPILPFQYWQETELLYFKGKKVKHLSEDDIKILNKMALYPNQFISLNEFNEMFTIDYENENYSAIVKRREKKLETFLQMIANISSYDFQDLLHERKNEIDKRIKEVLFLPKKIKFVKK